MTAPAENKIPKAERTPLLQAEHLRKVYGGRCVVNDVSLHVHPGEVVGLLGPNGAGKTTSFYMIVGMIAPDGGQSASGERISQSSRCTSGHAWEWDISPRNHPSSEN